MRGAMLRSLADRGHAVHAVGTALDALRRVAAETPDLVVLDLGLPDLDGADALRMLRGITDVPIIIATARDDEQGIVRLLRAGADDYMVKPFTGAHLDARITTVLRRVGRASRTVQPAVHEVGGLRVDVGERSALLDGDAARADPQGVRPAGLPRGPPGPGSLPPGVVGGGMAAAVGRRGPDDRRSPVLASPQTGRVRGEAALPAHRAGGRIPVGGTGLRLTLAALAAGMTTDRRTRVPHPARASLSSATTARTALSDAARRSAIVAGALPRSANDPPGRRAPRSTAAGGDIHVHGIEAGGEPHAGPRVSTSSAPRPGTEPLVVDVDGGVVRLEPVTGRRPDRRGRGVRPRSGALGDGSGARPGCMLFGIALGPGHRHGDRGRPAGRPRGRRPPAAWPRRRSALGDGDLTYRVQPSGPRELAEAGYAFNRMAERLVTSPAPTSASWSPTCRTGCVRR